MRILYRRKHETIYNLSVEFGVSARTIRRDIEVLSLTEPIYTVKGRFDGGIYIIDNYKSEFKYFNISEAALLEKLIGQAGEPLMLEPSDVETLKVLLATYSQPAARKKF